MNRLFLMKVRSAMYQRVPGGFALQNRLQAKVPAGVANPYGPEIVTSSPDFVISEWPVNVGWAFDSPSLGDITKSTDTNSNLEGFKTGQIVPGKTYRVQVEIFNYVSGTLRPELNGQNSVSSGYSGNILIDEEIIAGATTANGIRLKANGFPNEFALRNISVKEVLNPARQAVTSSGQIVTTGTGNNQEVVTWPI